MPPPSVRRLMLAVVDADIPRCEACRMTLSSSNAPRTDAAKRRDTSASSGATLGTLSFSVDRLAATHGVVTSTVSTNATDVIAPGGSITMTIGSTPHTISVGTGTLSDHGYRQPRLFLFERDVEDLEFLEQRVAGLGAVEFVRFGRQGAAGFAADPHPGLLGAFLGGEHDEMLEAGLGEGAVEL